MTGTFGAITLFAILISILKENLRVFNQDTPQSSNAELVSILAYLFVHGLAEGWIFAVGNPFCLLFWLALGRASNLQFGVNRNIILHESYDIRG
jgi:threonine/homoserine/homoserine lactone efflux protein